MAVQTRLATIMAVDVAGYSRAAETDQAAAAAAVAQLRARLEAVIAPLGGRIFSTAGDGMMVELPAASSGVQAALQLLADGEAQSGVQVRIGVHLGEVIVDERGDLLGHGVNVAARLQSLAEPGTAIISEAVRTQLRTAAEIPLQRLGRVQLDKMATRMSVYALAPGKRRSFARVGWRRARGAIIAAAAVAVIAVGALAWRAYGPHAPETTPRLAVLRLETLGDTEPYFSEGLADELITEMSRVRGLDVIARASSFALTGAEESATLMATVGVGVVNLVFTLVGLALIDRAGRKTLLLWGAVGYIVSLAGAAYGFANESYAIVLPCIFLFIASHAIGQGAVIWVYISEIFPTAARAMGQSLGASTHWVLAAALTLIMPGVLANVEAWMIFAAFAVFMAIELVWVLTMVKETRGRSLEELEREFSARAGTHS